MIRLPVHAHLTPRSSAIMYNLFNFVQGINNNGGATYNLNTGEFNPNNGYIVGLKGTQVKMDYDPLIIPDKIRSYISQFGSELTNPENYLGGWVENGELYLDVVVKISDQQDAHNAAVTNDQMAYYDCANCRSVYVK